LTHFVFFHPDDKERYSWWSYRELARASNRGWRIDCISVSKGLEKYIQGADILESVEGSDHCPILLEMDL
jgi:exodeoxyribonuclease-3